MTLKNHLLFLFLWLPVLAMGSDTLQSLEASFNEEKEKNPQKAGQLALEIGNIYLKEQKNIGQGLKYLREASALSTKAKDAETYAKANFELGQHFLGYFMYEESTGYLLNAANRFHDAQMWEEMVASLFYLGKAYYYLKDAENAYKYTSASLEQAKLKGVEHPDKKLAYSYIVVLEQKLGIRKETINSISNEKVLKNLEGSENRVISSEMLTEMVSLSEAEKMISEEEALREKLRKIEESWKKDAAKSQREKLKLEQEMAAKQKAAELELALREQEFLAQKKQDEERFIFSIGASGVFLIFTIFLIRSNRAKKRINTQLKKQNQEILEQKEEIESQKEEIESQKEEIEINSEKIKQEREKADRLLMNILPVQVAVELKETGKVTPKPVKEATILFTDFVGFTHIAERLTPTEIISELDTCFKEFDRIVTKHKLEKIKTIGDAYMCVGGVPVANSTHPVDAVRAGLEMQAYMEERKFEKQLKGEVFFELRVGVHTGGPLITGVVGEKKFAYDIWGDAVNVAARMEQASEAGRVNISEATYEVVKHYFYCNYRGKIEAKNKGEIDMYFVNGSF